MLNWSLFEYKFTLGFGSLGTALLLCKLPREPVPIWLCLAISVAPLIAFVLFVPGEKPPRTVRIAHVSGSVWYWAVAIGVLAIHWSANSPPSLISVGALFLTAGAIPCTIVIYRMVRGRYRDESERRRRGLQATGIDGRDRSSFEADDSLLTSGIHEPRGGDQFGGAGGEEGFGG